MWSCRRFDNSDLDLLLFIRRSELEFFKLSFSFVSSSLLFHRSELEFCKLSFSFVSSSFALLSCCSSSSSLEVVLVSNIVVHVHM